MYLSLIIRSRTSSASLSILESSPALLSVRNLEGVKLQTLIEESSKPQAMSKESSLISIQFILKIVTLLFHTNKIKRKKKVFIQQFVLSVSIFIKQYAYKRQHLNGPEQEKHKPFSRMKKGIKTN